jgi:sugar O-acyltransferase (sialic acid O-acetyltransferase NeuD family)
VAEAARSAGWIVAGFLDDDERERGMERLGLKRLGAIADLASALGPRPGARAHAAVGSPLLRRRWCHDIGDALAPPIVAASAVLSPSASVADGAFVGPLAIVNPRAVIGRGAIVNSGAIVEHDCVLGEFCHVGPGAALGGSVSIGRGALIGLNAQILPGVRIGDGASLGAGAVAVHDVPDGETAVGNPARPVACASR